MDDAAHVECDLRRLSSLLLGIYRTSVRERAFGDACQNAAVPHRDLERLTRDVPSLLRLREGRLESAGKPAEGSLHQRTSKLLLDLDSIGRCLGGVVRLPDGDSRASLVATSLDGIRDAGVLAFSLAHGWMDILQGWGRDPI